MADLGRVREVPLYHHCNGNGYRSNGCHCAYTIDSSDSSLLTLACCVEGKGKTGEAPIWHHLCGREVSVLEPSGSEEAQRDVQPCKLIVLTVALDCFCDCCSCWYVYKASPKLLCVCSVCCLIHYRRPTPSQLRTASSLRRWRRRKSWRDTWSMSCLLCSTLRQD